MGTRVVAWAAAIAAIAALAAAPGFAQTSEEVRAQAVPPVTDADDGSYRLSADDTIEIKFLQNPELNEIVQIRPDGRISMPLVGELLVAGATVAELATRLSTAYQDILRAPSVTIQVRNFANRRVFVGGEVNRPTVLPLVGRQTALGAVMEAGGWKMSARRSEVLVIRRGDEDQARIIRLSTENGPQGEGPEAAMFALQPLDVVLVTESGVARAGRAVDQYVRQMIPLVLTGGFSWLLGDSLGVR
jgi:protein involved in polysaccharide export with SLBB domain